MAVQRQAQPALLAISLKRLLYALILVNFSTVKNANFDHHFFLRVHLFSFR